MGKIDTEIQANVSDTIEPMITKPSPCSKQESEYEVWKPNRLNPALAELFFRRSITGLLNKLTPENFPTLAEKMKTLPIDTSTRMQQVVEMIHQKAILEWRFRALYAKLCDLMQDVEVVNELGIVKPFKLYLIAHCETFFLDSLTEEFKNIRKKYEIKCLCFNQEMRKSLMEEYEENEREFRRKSVGNCQFIGELFKVHLIHPKIIFLILDRLLEQNGNMAVESYCALLTTIGHFYEEKINKLPAFYFNQLELFLPSNVQISSRTRFMIENVLDLRKTSWRPRRRLELPKTLLQIEQEMIEEEKNQKLSESMFRLDYIFKRNECVDGGRADVKCHFVDWTDISNHFFKDDSESKNEENENQAELTPENSRDICVEQTAEMVVQLKTTVSLGKTVSEVLEDDRSENLSRMPVTKVVGHSTAQRPLTIASPLPNPQNKTVAFIPYPTDHYANLYMSQQNPTSSQNYPMPGYPTALRPPTASTVRSTNQAPVYSNSNVQIPMTYMPAVNHITHYTQRQQQQQQQQAAKASTKDRKNRIKIINLNTGEEYNFGDPTEFGAKSSTTASCMRQQKQQQAVKVPTKNRIKIVNPDTGEEIPIRVSENCKSEYLLPFSEVAKELSINGPESTLTLPTSRKTEQAVDEARPTKYTVEFLKSLRELPRCKKSVKIPDDLPGNLYSNTTFPKMMRSQSAYHSTASNNFTMPAFMNAGRGSITLPTRKKQGKPKNERQKPIHTRYMPTPLEADDPSRSSKDVRKPVKLNPDIISDDPLIAQDCLQISDLQTEIPSKAFLDRIKSSNEAPVDKYGILKKHLLDCLKTGNSDMVIKWIDENFKNSRNSLLLVPILTKTICEIIDEEWQKEGKQADDSVAIEKTMEKFVRIFWIYTENQRDLEMQCLLAVHEYVSKKSYPRGLLQRIFQFMFHLEVISYNTFMRWKNADTTSRVALEQLKQFFDYIECWILIKGI